MTTEIALLLSIILGALILFSIEIIPADIVALGIVLVLALSGLLPANQVFAGFGSDAFILILGLLILTAALLRTGVVEMAGEIILQRIGNSRRRLYLATMLIPAILSAFISNTAATALFIPIVIGLAKRSHLRASKMLMPLAFATILASSVTLVATSTNIVVSGLMRQYDMQPIGMFELAPVGIPILVVGLVYMYTIGLRLIPDRESTDKAYDQISTDPYLTEIRLKNTSTLVGKSLNQTRLGRDWDMTVLRVSREDDQILAPNADLELLAGDTLLVEANRDDIVRMIRNAGVELMADVPLAEAGLETGEYRLAEVILLLRSPLIGRTLSNADFRERFGLQVLAINRHGETISRNISQTPLHIGDILLVQGHRNSMTALQEDKTFRILGEVEPRHLNLKRAKIALGAFAGALLLATLNFNELTRGGFMRRSGRVCDRLYHSRRGIPGGRVEGADLDRQYAGGWGCAGSNGRSELPGPADRGFLWKRFANLAADCVLCAHNAAHPANVQPGGSGSCRAHRDPNCASAWLKSSDVRSNDRSGCQLFLSHPARTGLLDGLWSWRIPLCRLPQSRVPPYHPGLSGGYFAGPGYLASLVNLASNPS